MDQSSEVTFLFGMYRFDGKSMHLGMNPSLLLATGLWLGPGPAPPRAARFAYALCTLWMLLNLLGLALMGAAAAVVYRDDLVAIASNTCLSLQDVGAFVKAVLLVRVRGALGPLVRRLSSLAGDAVVARRGAAGRGALAEAGRQAAWVSFVFLAMGFVTYVAWMVSPAVLGTGLRCWEQLRGSSRSGNGSAEGAAGGTGPPAVAGACPPPTLPAEGWFFFDFYRNPGYGLAYAFQISCVFYMYIITSVIDTFFISMMIYISALLRVLSSDISSLRERHLPRTKAANYASPSASLEDSAAVELELESALADAVKFHQKIIDAVDAMKAVLSPIVLVQFVISMAVMCMALFATTSSGGNVTATAKFAAYLATLFSQLLLYCWFGDDVSQASEAVAQAAFGCRWFLRSREFRRCVRLVILRAQRPLAFRGGPFYDLSLRTFLYIVNGSYSFFNLLMQVQN